ncbi:hypothetical protein SAMN04487981_106460 [Streptomyces sp. cf386]|nr:hypothetical protein SAMN04487981_106460 [Streptomyces sp. cf386]
MCSAIAAMVSATNAEIERDETSSNSRSSVGSEVRLKQISVHRSSATACPVGAPANLLTKESFEPRS